MKSYVLTSAEVKKSLANRDLIPPSDEEKRDWRAAVAYALQERYGPGVGLAFLQDQVEVEIEEGEGENDATSL